MSAFVDTLLNVMVFVFIGLLIWLYVKKESGDSARDDSIETETGKKG